MAGYFLYIHGSNNVIRTMKIDLGRVIWAGEKSPRSSTEAMAREIARQIEERFENSCATQRENLAAIERIVPHLNPLVATRLQGIAIQVTGTIEGDESNGSPPGAVQKKINEIEQTYQAHLKVAEDQLKGERLAHTQTTNQLAKVQQRLTRAQRQIEQLQSQVRQHQNTPRQVEDTRKALEQLETERQERAGLEVRLQLAQEQTAKLQNELQLAQQAQQRLSELEDEYETARDEANEAKMDNERLQRYVEKLESSLADLHRSNERAFASSPQQEISGPIEIDW